MWISRTSWIVGVGVVGVISAHCSPPSNCLRYSDCDEGLTCAYGKCVHPPAPLPEGGAEEETGSTADAAGVVGETDAGPAGVDGPFEASGDAAAATGDDSAATGDDASGDATAE